MRARLIANAYRAYGVKAFSPGERDFAAGLDPANYTEVVFANFPTANVSMADDLRSPVVREVTVGGSRRLPGGVRLRATWVQRSTSHFIDDLVSLANGITTIPLVGDARATLEELSIAVQGYAPDGTVRYWNRACEHFYGYTEQEALGRNILELIIPPEVRAAVREAIAGMARSGEPVAASELMLMHKDGSRVPVYSSHAVVKRPGAEPELFCIDVDLSERKAAEAALERLNAELESRVERRTAELEAANRELSEFS